jgi:hypothetical protein|tara:strand:- start:21552 stop:21932 length:381 start_codon:yes stop_codon:yes gene_type:complete
MNKQIAKELNEFAGVIAKRYSQTEREGNVSKESFGVDEVIPTSDHTAVINFKKSSGKIGVAFCYYIAKGVSKGWKYFFPTDSHLNGFQAFLFYKLEAERKNYNKNFLAEQHNRNRKHEDHVMPHEL